MKNLTLDILDMVIRNRKVRTTELYTVLAKKWSVYSIARQLYELERRGYIRTVEESGEEYIEVGEKLD